MQTVEEAKKELKEYRESILYIKEQQEDIEELRGILEKTTTRLSLSKTDNNSMSTDKFSDGIDRISRIENEKDKKLAELLTKKFVVDEKIDKLGFPFCERKSNQICENWSKREVEQVKENKDE